MVGGSLIFTLQDMGGAMGKSKMISAFGDIKIRVKG